MAHDLTCPTCHTDIDAHPAGECLDAWIHTVIMPSDTVPAAYSRTLSHSWKVEGHLRWVHGIWFTIVSVQEVDQAGRPTWRYRAEPKATTRKRRRSCVWDTSLPLAICRAAIKAMVAEKAGQGRLV